MGSFSNITNRLAVNGAVFLIGHHEGQKLKLKNLSKNEVKCPL